MKRCSKDAVEDGELMFDSSVKGVHSWLFAASFSRPLLRRDEAADWGKDTSFYCNSAGGFPEPHVHWLINHTAGPPTGSVRTVATLLPDSYLYNVSSYLKVNISKALSVSCAVENALLNETFTSTSCEWRIRSSAGVDNTNMSPGLRWSPFRWSAAQ